MVAPPAAVTIRTKVRASAEDEKVLREVGTFLGGLFRSDLAVKCKLGSADKHAGRTERKRRLTADSSSRWAGSITRRVDDQHALELRNLAALLERDENDIKQLEKRLAVRTGEKKGGVKGCRSQAERYEKQRRLQKLRARRENTQRRLDENRVSVCAGSKHLARNRHHLEECDKSAAEWRERWDAERMFFTADGETGLLYGNPNIRVVPSSSGGTECPVLIRLPEGLKHLANTDGRSPVYKLDGGLEWNHRALEWEHQCNARGSISYTLFYDVDKQAWYILASWTVPLPETTPEVPLPVKCLGLDLNSDHIAAFNVDEHGNPVGKPASFPIAEEGSSAHRLGKLREAVHAALAWGKQHGAETVAVEKLDFVPLKSRDNEKHYRGKAGKTARRKVSGIPTSKATEAITSSARKHGLTVIAVDPAYTSKWGARYWRKPLNSSRRQKSSRHHAAALMIGRRSQGHAAKRKDAEPETTGGSSRTVCAPANLRRAGMPSSNGKGQQRGDPARDLLAKPCARTDRRSRSFGTPQIELQSI